MAFELHIVDEIAKFGDNSDYIRTYAFSPATWRSDFLLDVDSDLELMLIAIALVSTYSFFVLGSCSPVHFRVVTAIVGIGCVVLATTTGYAISFAVGQLISH